MNAIYILWLRELKRYFRSPLQVAVSLAQPTFFLLAFGFGFSPVFEQAGHGSYLQFLAPGMIGMTVLLSAVLSGIAMLWDRQFGFLKATLVAPVPRLYVMIGRTLGGATVGMVQGVLILLICIVAGFRPQHWIAALSAFVFIAMIAISFAALGTTMGSVIKDMQGFQLMVNCLLMPMTFLSGAFYPLSRLPKILSLITIINPVSYGVDGLRGTLVGLWHFSYLLDIFYLGCMTAVFLVMGAYSFSRIEI
ncbi:MAG: type transporter [Edaphobacter sp.]|jgi:ABC-2 type transport system permease protein|nr:type transporter [Edaphobacter sp.]